MASITAHLMIAHQVVEAIPLAEPCSFYLGAIAPDSVPSAEKSLTHFTERIAGKPYYRWDRFLNEYWRSCADEHGCLPGYCLGYCCHLLADEEWDRHIRFPLKSNPAFSTLPDNIRRPRYYAEMSSIDIAIRPVESIRKDITDSLTRAEYPGIPCGLPKERVKSCVEYACKDLFKLEEQVVTQFLDAGVVKDMCAAAVERIVNICRLLLS